MVQRVKATTQKRQAETTIPALLLAVHAGRADEVRSLLDAGADVNAADADGITPLMATAMNGNLSLARLLLSAGADRRPCNKWGMTAHAIALWHGHDALAAVIDDGNAHARGRTAKAFRKESVS